MASPETLPRPPIMLLDKPPRQLGIERQLPRSTKLVEDLEKFRFVRTAQQHLVLDTSQERFISQLLGLQISREDEKRLERDRHLTAGVERQIIHAAFHGDNPAVEHFGRSAALASEIVDQVDAVVGFHLI